LCGVLAAEPVMGWRLVLCRYSRRKQPNDVTSVDVIKDRKSGESNGFAFVTMSAQSEADKAVSMFHAYPIEDRYLRVALVRSRTQRGSGKM
jgi:RNA recognition motif-containing protein